MWETSELEKDYFLYKLKEGETLQTVAKKFEVPPQMVYMANQNLEIFEGVTIVIPTKKRECYTVTAEDTLEGVCEKLGITKEYIKTQNGVGAIYHGMKIWL